MREHHFCPVEYFHDSPEAMPRLGRIKPELLSEETVRGSLGRC